MQVNDCVIGHKCPYSECTGTECESYKAIPESLNGVIAAAEHQMMEDGTPALPYPLAKRLLKALRVSMIELREFEARLVKIETVMNGDNETKKA